MRADGVLTAQIALAEAKYPEEAQQTAFFRQLLERLRAMPGVESAASIFPLPLSGSRFVLVISIEGRPAPPPNDVPTPDVASASPGYFQTAGIPMLAGRDFTFQDTETSQPVVIINQTMARRLWPGESPLGKRITFDDVTAPEPEWLTIVGVVGDVRNKDLGEEPGMQAYWPQLQTPISSAVLLVRTSGREPASLAAALREAVAATDRDLPIDQVRTLEEVIASGLAQSRFKSVLLGLFAGLALVLAAVGVYGVISYSVAQRTHEIGIRMALGAHRGQVLRMVVRQGMGLVGAGVLAGLVLAWFAVRLLTDQVYGISPSDPATFALVPLVLLAVALLANYLPARRATRVDPLEALRYE
jgi:putative ABC transport system permease protein